MPQASQLMRAKQDLSSLGFHTYPSLSHLTTVGECVCSSALDHRYPQGDGAVWSTGWRMEPGRLDTHPSSAILLARLKVLIQKDIG